MLMNGIGIVGTLERMPEFFRQLDKILAPGGQVLCDSSDISYVFETEDGIIELPDDMSYYGEHSFRMQYKDTIGEPFDWLYIDTDTLKEKAVRNGYAVEVVADGEHYDYLARITKIQTELSHEVQEFQINSVDSKPDVEKMGLITFDPVHHTYIQLGKTVGNAFSDGKQLK